MHGQAGLGARRTTPVLSAGAGKLGTEENFSSLGSPPLLKTSHKTYIWVSCALTFPLQELQEWKEGKVPTGKSQAALAM